MLDGDQVSDCLTKIPKKTIACRRAFHNVAGQNRQPESRIVAPQVLELQKHIVGPVLRPRFPAVVDYITPGFGRYRIGPRIQRRSVVVAGTVGACLESDLRCGVGNRDLGVSPAAPVPSVTVPRIVPVAPACANRLPAPVSSSVGET